MSKHVVSLGDIVLDLITPVRLPVTAFNHQETQGAHVQPGGSGNFMIAGTRMGMKMSPVGMVGGDVFSKILLDMLQTEGIPVEGVAIIEDSTSTLVLDLIDRETHEHVFIGNVSVGEMVPFTPTVDAIIRSADAVFLQGYTLLETQLADLVPAVLKLASEQNIPIYFDTGPTVKGAPVELVRATMRQCDVLLMTEDEVPLATQGLSGEAAYAFLLDLGVKLVVVKQGANGCLLVTQNGREQVPGYPVIVADTVGAGDCFDSAFIYGQVNKMELRQCAELANAMGAASVQKVGGGRNVPTCAEVQAILDQFQVKISLPC